MFDDIRAELMEILEETKKLQQNFSKAYICEECGAEFEKDHPCIDMGCCHSDSVVMRGDA